MTNYVFKTKTTMKPYNNEKWWIDSDVIREIRIQAENLQDALMEYKEYVSEAAGVEISNNALKNKEPMYVDISNGAKQVGYVITGKTEFEDRDKYKCSKQYIDLWVTILTVVDTDFD